MSAAMLFILAFELVTADDMRGYWATSFPEVFVWDVSFAFVLGLIQGFSISVVLLVLIVIFRGRLSVRGGALMGGVISAAGGCLLLLVMGMLNSEGVCSDLACWVGDLFAFVGVPIGIGSWLGWRLACYCRTTKRWQRDNTPEGEGLA